MNRSIAFFVDGHPRTKGRIASFVNPRTGRIVSKETDKRTAPWVARIGALARVKWQAGPAPKAVAFFAQADFYYTRPKCHFKADGRTLRQNAPAFPIGRGHYGDVDKLTRAILDGLSGIVYEDDTQVVFQTTRKEFGTDEGVFLTIEVWTG